jgi:hypothetical protein
MYVEFLLEIDFKILLRKTGTRLNLKIELISLHIDPGANPIKLLRPLDSFSNALKSEIACFYQVNV